MAEEGHGVHRHRLGWEFRVPAGWRVKDVQGATALAPPGTDYDPARTDLAQLYVVAAHEAVDPGDSRLAEALPRTLVEAGIRPPPHPRRESLNERDRRFELYAWWGRAMRGAVMMETRVYVVPAGPLTLLLVASGESDLLKPHDAELREVAASLKLDARPPARGLRADWGLTRPVPPGPGTADPPEGALADDSARSQRWLYYLRGKVLTPGDESARALRLAADGRFQSSPSNAVGRKAPPGMGGPPARGRWRIVTQGGATALVLHGDDGRTSYLALVQQGGRTYVDGTLTAVTKP